MEKDSAIVDTDSAISSLRQLCLDDFGRALLEMPMDTHPKLSSYLPRMASEQVQQNWTGSSGITLLRQSLNFARILQARSYEMTGTGLGGKRILDYGCGYGRILRLMSYFTDSSNLFGCDPWDESIRLCKEAGLNCNFEITDYLPDSLPYEAHSIDFSYAFSVFTHTSERASKTALNALHGITKPSGHLAITIRPVEYWAIDQAVSEEERETLEQDHKNKGYAFKPHNRDKVDGDITYGDTSMTMEKLSELCPKWDITAYDRSLEDPYQIIVYLKPT
ncbi:MAG: class I SAM-dependent methyltransferase [Maricaulaceae bacterium]